jgi:hypothetical protein
MSSSIGEAKERIAAASEAADEAKKAIDAALSAVDDAVKALNDAASDSDHEKISEARGSYGQVSERLEESTGLITAAQKAADEYAAQLG